MAEAAETAEAASGTEDSATAAAEEEEEGKVRAAVGKVLADSEAGSGSGLAVAVVAVVVESLREENAVHFQRREEEEGRRARRALQRLGTTRAWERDAQALLLQRRAPKAAVTLKSSEPLRRVCVRRGG